MPLSESHPSDGLLTTDIQGYPKQQGRVRDVYDLGDTVALVATDRIGASEQHAFPTAIPGKGRVLTALSAFWFNKLDRLIPELKTHQLTTKWPVRHTKIDPHREQLEGRVTFARKVQPLPVESIVRGYSRGETWADAERLCVPMFTPVLKGHNGQPDAPIVNGQLAELVGNVHIAGQIRALSVDVFQEARKIATAAGLEIFDTKLEWGIDAEGMLRLSDKAFTPDTTRFATLLLDGTPDRTQMFDRQQFLSSVVRETGWDMRSEAPDIPPLLVEETRARYFELYKLLTGETVTKT